MFIEADRGICDLLGLKVLFEAVHDFSCLISAISNVDLHPICLPWTSKLIIAIMFVPFTMHALINLDQGITAIISKVEESRLGSKTVTMAVENLNDHRN